MISDAITNLAVAVKDAAVLIDCPVRHFFTPGLYAREIFMPANTFAISEIHKTEHPYIISQGIVKVWTEETGTQLLYAPFFGITKPNTRRALLTVTDTIWTTFHVTDLKDPEKIGDEILVRFDSLPKDDEFDLETIKEKLKLCS